MLPGELQLFRQRLEAMRAEYQEKVAVRSGQIGATAGSLPDYGDEAGATFERMRTAPTLECAEALLALVRQALRRIDLGTYGICTECNQPIDTERLEVRPESPYCCKCSKSVSRVTNGRNH